MNERSFVFQHIPNPMSDSLSKGERTSQVILKAAYSLFIEQGFHATSMRQIAQRAGVALGGIYNHFESKDQIFDRVLLEEHPYRRVLEILQSAPGETMGEFVHNAAHAAVTELGNRPDFIKLAFIEFIEFKGKHAPNLFRMIYPQFMPLWQRFIGDQSQLRRISPQVISLAFVGVFFSYYLAESVTNPANSMPPNLEILEQYLDIFLHGVLEPEKP
jgi:AcrR family transcriptional regulator